MDDFLAKPARAEDLAQALSRAPAAQEVHGEIARRLARLDAGLPGLREDVLRELCVYLPAQLQRLVAAQEGGDRAQVALLSHTLRGSVGLVGATRLAALLGQVELAASGAEPRASQPLEEVQEEAALVMELVRALAQEEGCSR